MDVQDIRQFFIASLQSDSNLSDIDTSQDSNFDDLVTKPHIMYSKTLFDELENYRKTISLSNRKYLTSDQLDAVASKFFVKRRDTSSVSLEITVYLNTSNNSILQILTSDTFRTSDSISFSPIQNYIYLPSTLPTITSNNQTYRVAKFTVVSNNATRQVMANEISSYTINHPSLANVLNLRNSSVPVLSETNDELNTKIDNSLFTKNNINRPSIFNNLTEAFPDLVSVYSIGYGDPEMQRDIVPAGKAWSFHVGGTIDIFIRGLVKPTTITSTATRVSGNIYKITLKRYKGYDAGGIDNSNPNPNSLYGWQQIQLPDSAMPGISNLPELPLMYIDLSSSSSFAIGTLGLYALERDSVSQDYKIEIKTINSQNLRYSIYEQLEIRFYLTQDAGDNPVVTLPYYTLSSIEDIQNYLNDQENIFQCSDTVVKSFIPVEIRDLTIKYDKRYSIDQKSLANQLSDIINGWNSPEHIRLSTLLSNVPVPVRIGELGEDFPELLFNPDGYITSSPSSLDQNTYNALPTYVEVIQHNIDGSVFHFVSTDQICSIEKPVLSATRRTVKYFVEASNINFVPTTW